MKEINFSNLIGKTLVKIEQGKRKRNGNECLVFITSEGEEYEMFHSQDCCEDVFIDDINGDLDWLINTPVLSASEDSNSENPKEFGGHSFTWTFYRISTIKGTVVIKWYGSSNGYYSESVSFYKVK